MPRAWANYPLVAWPLDAQGARDAYAQFLYGRIGPLTDLGSVAQRPAIAFACGTDDDDAPPDGACVAVGVATGPLPWCRRGRCAPPPVPWWTHGVRFGR